jgi:two-component system NarL family sensor kinase
MVLGKIDDAEKYLTRAKKITNLSGNLPVRSYVLASFAILMDEQNKIDESLLYGEEALNIKRLLGQKRQMQNDLLNISEAYMKLKRYNEAKKVLSEAISIANDLRDFVYLHYFYDVSARLDSITGNYSSAYSSMKQAMIFKDSVVSLKKMKAVEEIRLKYEAEQQEKIIAEKELQIEQHKLRQYTTIGILSITILMLIIILLWLRNRHRIRIQTVRLQTIIQTQEEVQQSIARDIHDGLVQVLGAAKISLQAISPEANGAKIQERIKEASRIIDEACVEARGISHQILPYSLMKDGLVPAIGELLRKSIPDHQYEFTHGDSIKRFNENIEINVYRVAQELVNNIIKHAEALKTSIELEVDQAILTLTCKDNGKGFDTTQKGVGITNIFTRAELMGGLVKLESNPGKGTIVQIKIPI